VYDAKTIRTISQPLRRRTMLRAALGLTAGAAAGAVLAACGETAAPTATAAPTIAAARPTVAPTTAAAPVASVAASAMTAAPAPAMAMTAATVAAPASAPTTAPAAPMTAPAVAPTAPVAAAMTRVQPAPDADGKIASFAPNVPDAYVKLPKAFQSVSAPPGKGSKVTALIAQLIPAPPGRTENRYWQELEKRLGVASFDVTWASTATYREKMATVIAGGELPDLTFLDLGAAPDLNRTIQQGAWADLTPYLSGAGLAEFPNLAKIPAFMWKNVAIGGKIYGVPRPRFLAGSALTIRQDWMDKVGFSQPKNGDEFFQMLAAFRNRDPDGNGQQDSYGLVADSRGVFAHTAFAYMFRVPNNWRLESNGNLTNAVETEEFRAAIAYQRRVFEAGLFHPDSVTFTDRQMKDAFIASKAGGFMDSVTGLPTPTGRRVKTKEVTPSANPVGIIPPGHDGGRGVSHNASGYFGFAAIPARVARDRERTKELLRILDWYVSPFGSEEWRFKSYGLEGVHHTLAADGNPQLTETGVREIQDLPNLTNAPQVFYYISGDADYLQRLVADVLAVGIDNPVQTVYSPTAITKAAELDQLRIDRLTAIISGREPLSALDTYVRDWRSRGGDQMRKEYQDGLKA